MKVQVGPWKTIRTNGSFGRRVGENENTKSRSNKNGKTNEPADEIVGLTFHGAQKRGHASSTLTITRPKQISILKEEQQGGGSLLTETVVHASRAGKAASFAVPAVRSVALGGIFALQGGNQQLIFLPTAFPAGSQQRPLENGGHDHNNKHMLVVDLDSPVIQLDLLVGGSSSTATKGAPMVFGVCQDGRVFLASISLSSSLQVQYLGPASTKNEAVRVSNVCQLDLQQRGNDHQDHPQSHNKRQRDGRAVVEETGVCILKSTGNNKTVDVVSYVWNDSFRIGGTAFRTNARPLPAQHFPADLKGVVLLGSLTSDAVCIRVADLALSVSRRDGRLVSRPLLVPGSTKCIAMAGSGTLVMLIPSSSSSRKAEQQQDELVFVDVRRDMVVGRETLEATSHGQAVAVVTDPRENRIAVIAILSDKDTMILSADITLASEEGSISSLAAALQSAVEVDHQVRPRKKGTTKQCHIADALSQFESACEDVLAGKKTKAKRKEKSHLIESFSSMVDKVKKSTRNGHSTLPELQNGQVHENGAKNGRTSVDQPSTIHPRLVGPSTALMVRLLSSPSCDCKNDCRFILRRLIYTGYVSTRIHLAFPDIFYCCTDNQSEGVNEVSCYTPLEVMHDILDHCSDVSERIMIISLKFCMSRISDESIMSYVRKSKRKSAGSDEVAAYDLMKNDDTDRPATLRRIRLMAVADLLSKMIGYSSCNDGILRHAMASELSSRELCLLIRLMRDFRVPVGSDKTIVLHMTPSLIVWLSCALDVARTDSKQLLEQVSAWIRNELGPMEAMFVLGAMLQHRLSQEHSAPAAAGLKNRSDQRQNAAGYQIERVQF